MLNHEFSGQAADSLYGEPATFATQGFNHSFYTYLLLREGVDPNELERKFPEFLEKYLGEQLRSFGVEAKLFLQPVVDIHLFSDIDVEIGRQQRYHGYLHICIHGPLHSADCLYQFYESVDGPIGAPGSGGGHSKGAGSLSVTAHPAVCG